MSEDAALPCHSPSAQCLAGSPGPASGSDRNLDVQLTPPTDQPVFQSHEVVHNSISLLPVIQNAAVTGSSQIDPRTNSVSQRSAKPESTFVSGHAFEQGTDGTAAWWHANHERLIAQHAADTCSASVDEVQLTNAPTIAFDPDNTVAAAVPLTSPPGAARCAFASGRVLNPASDGSAAQWHADHCGLVW